MKDKIAARRQLLSLLSKAQLGELSELDNPDWASRPDLTEIVLAQWVEFPSQMGEEVAALVKAKIDKLLEKAR